MKEIYIPVKFCDGQSALWKNPRKSGSSSSHRKTASAPTLSRPGSSSANKNPSKWSKHHQHHASLQHTRRTCVCSPHQHPSLRAGPRSRLPTNCSPPGSSTQGVYPGRTLEWVAMPSSRRSSQPTDQTCVCCTGRRILHCLSHRSPSTLSVVPRTRQNTPEKIERTGDSLQCAQHILNQKSKESKNRGQ